MISVNSVHSQIAPTCKQHDQRTWLRKAAQREEELRAKTHHFRSFPSDPPPPARSHLCTHESFDGDILDQNCKSFSQENIFI